MGVMCCDLLFVVVVETCCCCFLSVNLSYRVLPPPFPIWACPYGTVSCFICRILATAQLPTYETILIVDSIGEPVSIQTCPCHGCKQRTNHTPIIQQQQRQQQGRQREKERKRPSLPFIYTTTTTVGKKSTIKKTDTAVNQPINQSTNQPNNRASRRDCSQQRSRRSMKTPSWSALLSFDKSVGRNERINREWPWTVT